MRLNQDQMARYKDTAEVDYLFSGDGLYEKWRLYLSGMTFKVNPLAKAVCLELNHSVPWVFLRGAGWLCGMVAQIGVCHDHAAIMKPGSEPNDPGHCHGLLFIEQLDTCTLSPLPQHSQTAPCLPRSPKPHDGTRTPGPQAWGTDNVEGYGDHMTIQKYTRTESGGTQGGFALSMLPGGEDYRPWLQSDACRRIPAPAKHCWCVVGTTLHARACFAWLVCSSKPCGACICCMPLVQFTHAVESNGSRSSRNRRPPAAYHWVVAPDANHWFYPMHAESISLHANDSTCQVCTNAKHTPCLIT